MNQKPIVELLGDGSAAGVNIYGKGIDEILLRADYVVDPAGEVYFYQQDHEGSVTHLTDIAGTVIESYRYDAFGAPTTLTSSGNYNNRFLFTGREYAATFGFYEYRARAYNPTLGRFMSEDPKGFDAGDYNLFRYVGNDPLDRVDPMGLADESVNAKMVQTGVVVNLPMHVGSNIPTPVAVPVFVPTAALVEQRADPITHRGMLRADTDGTGKSYGDPTHQNQASAMMNAQGQLVPRRADQVGRNGNRDLNADTDRYVAAPESMASVHGGPLHLGDRATVILRDGRQQTAALGDFGPPGRHGEVSVAMGRDFGYRPLLVVPRTGRPEVDFSRNGRTTPDIPVTVIYYPGTYGGQ